MTHLGLAIALQLLALGHVLPDGVVERGVQVTAHDDQLEIRYLVGFNDATLARKLAELVPNETPPDDPQQALDLYRQHILPALASGLTVLLDDQPQAVLPVETRRGTLHHVQLECVYQVRLPPRGQVLHLKLLDRNFAADPGNHRMAAKGRGDVQLDDCSVPPILARVPLVAFDQLPPATAAENRQVEATIRRPGAEPAAVSPAATVEPLVRQAPPSEIEPAAVSTLPPAQGDSAPPASTPSAQADSAPLESVRGAWPAARRILLVAGLLAVACGAARLVLQRSPRTT